jgi:hypothetical protein
MLMATRWHPGNIDDSIIRPIRSIRPIRIMTPRNNGHHKLSPIIRPLKERTDDYVYCVHGGT